MKITKRDGRKVEFDKSKIEQAVVKAALAEQMDDISANNLGKRIAQSVAKSLENEGKAFVDIESVQDAVEEALMQKHPSIAKAYILYRHKKAKLRRVKAGAGVALIEEYLKNSDWRIKENSNMGFSLQGLNNYIASDISQEFWLNEVYDEHIRKAHATGDLHIHDLGSLSSYCVGWDLQDLLRVGFTGAPGKVCSSPAKHFRTALGQLVNFIYTLQGEAAGAQAVSSFDTLLAPFIRRDNLDYKQVKQALQEFVFNLNVPTRTGYQTPFSNITMDMMCPSILANVPVVIGGEDQEYTYSGFQKEMDMLNKAFCEVMTEGDASGRIFSFPIPTYNIHKGFDWDSDRYAPVFKMSGKYGIPSYANYINSDMNPEDARSMCCRLKLDNRELRKRGGGLFGANPLTGSIGVVTVNLPRLGYDSKDEQEFFNKLEEQMNIAKDSLCVKRKAIEEFTEAGLYPYTKVYLRAVKERFGKFWANHFSTIGLLGMNEACLNLIGCEIATPEGKAFAVRVLTFMREKIAGYQEETGDYFNLEATPAEGTSYRLALLDRRSGRDMVFANGRADSPEKVVYYTNSSQLPVGHTDDVFAALDHQDDLQCLYSGGTTLHVFLQEKIDDPKAVMLLVKTIAENYKLPFFDLTPTFSVCPDHGYLAGEVEVCPKCSKPTEVYSRVVGFYRPVGSWNAGKAQEFKDRKEYVLIDE
jgi:ribonucleoside-triphosphate reductase (formate)